MCKCAVKAWNEGNDEVNRLNLKNTEKYNEAFVQLGLKYLIVV